jgi:hypothetical protein
MYFFSLGLFSSCWDNKMPSMLMYVVAQFREIKGKKWLVKPIDLDFPRV